MKMNKQNDQVMTADGFHNDSDEIKDRYDTIDCRDFRITNSGYIFVEYEASCLDKDGKETDSI